MKFENMSVSVRHVIAAAVIAVPLVGGMFVGGARLTAVEDRVSGDGGLAEKVEKLTIEQAVMNTKLDNIDENMREDKEEILTYLRRIEDKVDRR